jgi:hypothetical protein
VPEPIVINPAVEAACKTDRNSLSYLELRVPANQALVVQVTSSVLDRACQVGAAKIMTPFTVSLREGCTICDGGLSHRSTNPQLSKKTKEAKSDKKGGQV